MTTAPSPSCPRCGATMVRKPVRRGPRAGLEMWSCTRWPDCRGAINIDPEPVSGTTRGAPDAMEGIDHLVVGPTGVFAIETKNWSGRVEVRNDRLFVGNQDRTWVVEQVYREALAVQVALGDELTAERVTVTPVICAIGGVAWFERTVAGVRVTDGKHLARLLADRSVVFDDERVQRIARLADQRLRAS